MFTRARRVIHRPRYACRSCSNGASASARTPDPGRHAVELRRQGVTGVTLTVIDKHLAIFTHREGGVGLTWGVSFTKQAFGT